MTLALQIVATVASGAMAASLAFLWGYYDACKHHSVSFGLLRVTTCVIVPWVGVLLAIWRAR